MSAFIRRHLRLSVGFTIVELMVVTMIIGLLAVLAWPTITAYLQRTRVARGVSTARTVQATLAAYSTSSERNQYPAVIGTFGELLALVNAHGGQLEDTELEEGMEFRRYTALDIDGDDTWESYTMSFRVTNVPTKRLGWCITIQPSGVQRCQPQ